MPASGYEPVVDTVRDLVRAAAGTVVVVGIAGAVCAGKTSASGYLRASLAPIETEIVATDGFLFPAAELDRRGLTMRKGFPESYDEAAIRRFLVAVRGGSANLAIPIYSHETYDVVPGANHCLADAAVVIVEGVNALRFRDYLDLGIYIDAPENVIETWYVDRFLKLCASATPASFYANFAGLDDAGRREMARHVWAVLNHPNLTEFIAPTRALASLVVHKAPDHSVIRVNFSGERA